MWMFLCWVCVSSTQVLWGNDENPFLSPYSVFDGGACSGHCSGHSDFQSEGHLAMALAFLQPHHRGQGGRHLFLLLTPGPWVEEPIGSKHGFSSSNLDPCCHRTGY